MTNPVCIDCSYRIETGRVTVIGRPIDECSHPAAVDRETAFDMNIVSKTIHCRYMDRSIENPDLLECE